MKFQEHKNSAAYDPNMDNACAHCLQPFDDGDDVARCILTDHLTHSVCVGHDN